MLAEAGLLGRALALHHPPPERVAGRRLAAGEIAVVVDYREPEEVVGPEDGRLPRGADAVRFGHKVAAVGAQHDRGRAGLARPRVGELVEALDALRYVDPGGRVAGRAGPAVPVQAHVVRQGHQGRTPFAARS